MKTFSVEQNGEEMTLRRRQGSAVAGGFLLVWLAFWTIGCVALAVHVIHQPTPEHLLLGIPFWAGEVFVACLVIGMLFGTEQVRIDREGIEFRRRIVVDVGGRHIPLEEILGVTTYTRITRGKHGTIQHGIKVITLGRPLRFGLGVPQEEATRVSELVRQDLQSLIPDRHIDGVSVKSPDWAKILTPEVCLPYPPSDSRIRLQADWDRTELIRRGSWSLAGLGVLTFSALFWNGVVSVFVLKLTEQFEWGMGLFLIPFILVGLRMILGWFAALGAPLFVRRWALSPYEITARWSILGLGRTHGVEMADLARIELRSGGASSFRFGTDGENDTPYSLALVTRDGADGLVIGGLTEGDARWVGGLILATAKGGVPAGSLHDPWVDSR